MRESVSSFPPHGHTWNPASTNGWQGCHCTLTVLCWTSCSSQNCLLHKCSSRLLHLKCYSEVVLLVDCSPYLQVFQFVLWCSACAARPRRSRRWECRWHGDQSGASSDHLARGFQRQVKLRLHYFVHLFDHDKCGSLKNSGFDLSWPHHKHRFPEASWRCSNLISPKISECYFWSRSWSMLPCKQLLTSLFSDNLFNALFRHRLVHNDGVWLSLPKFWTTVSCSEQVHPIHSILFRSPMCWIMNFSWFTEIRECFCFAGITVIWIKRGEENRLSSFFAFFTSCHQSRFRNRESVSCATHVVDELFPLVRNLHVLHQFWLNNHSAWKSLNRSNVYPFTICILTNVKCCFVTSTINVIDPILFCTFFFQLTLEFPHQYWEYRIPMPCSIFFSFILITVSNHVRDLFGNASFRGVSIVPGNSTSCSFPMIGFCSRMCWNMLWVRRQWFPDSRLELP